MKKIFCLLVCLVMAIVIVPSTMKADDDEPVNCSGVNRIEVNDPAELKGEPNDIKRVTLEVTRTRNSEGKQVRKVTITFNVHTRYAEKPGYVLIALFVLDTLSSDGKHNTFSISGRMLSGSGNADYFFADDEMISSIETQNNIKLICTRIMFGLGLINPENGDVIVCDETDFSSYVDFSNTSQPQNPQDVKAENDVGCVKVSWKKPQAMSGDIEVMNYRVYRDGALVSTLPANATFFKDCDVVAGATYKYGVCAISPWLVEGPKTPLTYTYTPVPKIIPDKTEIDFGQIEIDKLKSQKIKLSNYGDMDADCKLEATDDWFTVTPPTLKLEKTKRADVEIAINPDKVKPNTQYEGSIKVTWGSTDFLMISVGAYVKADKTPPDFKVDEITEVINQLQYTITGTVEPGATVVVNNVPATVEGDKFNATITLLPAPSITQVEVKATDKYGNMIKKNVGKVVNILNSNIVLVIGSEKMMVNNKEVAIKPAPQIIGGKTLVPLRAVADAFGAVVSWDADSKTASIILRDKTILITLDKDTAMINGNPAPIGSKAILLVGRVMVPFRFIAEALGAKVDYNGETKTITLSLEVRP